MLKDTRPENGTAPDISYTLKSLKKSGSYMLQASILITDFPILHNFVNQLYDRDK